MSNICYGVDMSKEIWRDVPWATDYEASNWGKVRSKDKFARGRNNCKRLIRGKELTVNAGGQVTLNGESHPLYRVIATTFINDFSIYDDIEYLDGNKLNCRLDNIRKLFKDNMEVKLNKLSNICQDVPVIEGGFGEGKRVLFDITLAEKVNKELWDFRSNVITLNIYNLEKGIDYLDLKEYSDFNEFVPMLLELGYTEKGLINSEHIYIFSERGVPKVMATLRNSNPAKWEFLNNFVNEYFGMREQIKNQVPQIDIRTQAIIDIVNASASGDAVQLGIAIGNFEKNITAPLIETIEEQKPKVAKYDKLMESDGTYNATNAAKILDIPTAQQFNKLLKDNKIQYKSGGNWVLYSKYQWLIDEGFAKYIEGENTNYSYIQLRWFPKGIEWIRDNILAI